MKKPESVRYEAILCPLDFSDESLKAREYGLSLAQEADARIMLLHVREGFVDEPDFKEFRDVNVLEYYQHREAEAMKRMMAAVPDEARVWSRPTEQVAKGKAYHQILRIVEEEKADLIVMGVRGRGALERLLFGSTTDHVVRRATCPVLTIRNQQ